MQTISQITADSDLHKVIEELQAELEQERQKSNKLAEQITYIWKTLEIMYEKIKNLESNS